MLHAISKMSGPVGRLVASAFVLFHFSAIAVGICNEAWICQYLSAHVFRPYRQFMYLEDNYRYFQDKREAGYSLWFIVKYEDDNGATRSRCIKIPDLDSDGAAIAYEAQGYVRATSNLTYCRSLSMVHSMSAAPERDPRLRGFEFEPSNFSKLAIASYARHVGRTFKYPIKPQLPVSGVRVYFVERRIPTPEEVTRRIKFNDDSLWSSYFLGEFATDGVMKSECRQLEWQEDGTLKEIRRDPRLYQQRPMIDEKGWARSEFGGFLEGK